MIEKSGFNEKMLVLLFQNLNSKEADTYGLILSAAGIFFQTRKEKSGWQISVHDHDETEALFHVQKFIDENARMPEKVNTLPIAEKIQIFNGVWVAVLIMVVYIAVGDNREMFTDIYGASASKIMAGEMYRTVTALLLHADTVHLIGNMVGIALFGAVVCAINGAGVGWLMILFSGCFGNYLNALLYQSHHTAVGISTAIFGAVGMMATYQFWNKFRQSGERYKAWLPIAGGIALLGILGSGEGRVDIMAHLFGFCCGIFIQAVYQGFVVIWHKQVLPMRYQVTGAGVCLAVLVMACIWPVLK